ncbi:MAG: tyrosine-type recombinase/integrase [Pseudomonadota bacterium]
MLTDTQCRNAKPKDKPYKLSDEKGLYLEVKPSGVKSWRYRFEFDSEGQRKESTFTIGEYGASASGETPEQAKVRRDRGIFSLSEARDARAEARSLVKQGLNPVRNRELTRLKVQHEASDLVEGLANEWLALRDWEEVTKKHRLAMLSRVVFPRIGNFPIRQVTPAHVLDILTKAGKENGLTVRDEAKRTLYGIFELAVETERADANPVRQWRGVLPANKTQHKTPLSKEEIGQFLRDLAGYERNFQTVAAFKLMWMTLCRPSEVTGARWNEISLENATWTIPAERMKKRKEHKVSLPRQAVQLLQDIKGVTGHRDLVFPNRDDRSKPMTDATLRMALKYLNWSTKYSPHATRTTGSTRLHEMGFHSDWIERQLAHADQNKVRSTYNHADYFSDRVKMMQHWADCLDEMRDGAEVIPLHIKAA